MSHAAPLERRSYAKCNDSQKQYAAGQAYGAIRAALEAKGAPIGNDDLWIAAHARAAGLTLVTNNEGEFQRVQDLEIENWAAPPEAADGET